MQFHFNVKLVNYQNTLVPLIHPNHTKHHTRSIFHSDVWGPSRIKNLSGTRWFVTFIDDHTHVTWIFLMKDKSEVRNIFQVFHKMIETQFRTKIQVFKTDNGTEFF